MEWCWASLYTLSRHLACLLTGSLGHPLIHSLAHSAAWHGCCAQYLQVQVCQVSCNVGADCGRAVPLRRHRGCDSSPRRRTTSSSHRAVPGVNRTVEAGPDAAVAVRVPCAWVHSVPGGAESSGRASPMPSNYVPSFSFETPRRRRALRPVKYIKCLDSSTV